MPGVSALFVAFSGLLMAAGCGSGSGSDPEGSGDSSAPGRTLPSGAGGGLPAVGGSGAGGGASTGGTSGAGAAGSGGIGSGTGGAPAGGTGGTGGGIDGTGGMGTSGAGTGGAETGGASTGGAGTGGAGAGGAGTGGSGGGDAAYPCDGDTSGYNAVVTGSGSSWVAQNGTRNVYRGGDMRAAIQAALDSLSRNRTRKESVLVQGSGAMPASSRLSVPSYTVLNICGTIDVTGGGSGDNAPIYARGRTDIEIPNVTISGTPLYAMFFRDVENLRLGHVELRVANGLGIRVDNHGRSNRADKVKDIDIDYVYAEGTGSHGVETYGVDGLRIGTVIARDTGECGVLLNDTVNAEIGIVDAVNAGTGTGYAAFRLANRAGRIGDGYPTNIRVGQVVARGGGRGIFCVSESGGVTIDRIDVADTGSNSILIENCHNVNIAAESGTVTGGGDIRLAARDEFANSSDITIQNLTVTNTAVNESPCATNSTFRNLTLMNARDNTCD
ncbi:right-handed parallel beta-helix repeat-containing protein [Sorangium cellulosum]|nr:right-handed parallel beta-helix repeat-containing protein [Sorangium cellulosum]